MAEINELKACNILPFNPYFLQRSLLHFLHILSCDEAAADNGQTLTEVWFSNRKETALGFCGFAFAPLYDAVRKNSRKLISMALPLTKWNMLEMRVDKRGL